MDLAILITPPTGPDRLFPILSDRVSSLGGARISSRPDHFFIVNDVAPGRSSGRVPLFVALLQPVADGAPAIKLTPLTSDLTHAGKPIQSTVMLPLSAEFTLDGNVFKIMPTTEVSNCDVMTADPPPVPPARWPVHRAPALGHPTLVMPLVRPAHGISNALQSSSSLRAPLIVLAAAPGDETLARALNMVLTRALKLPTGAVVRTPSNGRLPHRTSTLVVLDSQRLRAAPGALACLGATWARGIPGFALRTPGTPSLPLPEPFRARRSVSLDKADAAADLQGLLHAIGDAIGRPATRRLDVTAAVSTFLLAVQAHSKVAQ